MLVRNNNMTSLFSYVSRGELISAGLRQQKYSPLKFTTEKFKTNFKERYIYAIKDILLVLFSVLNGTDRQIHIFIEKEEEWNVKFTTKD